VCDSHRVHCGKLINKPVTCAGSAAAGAVLGSPSPAPEWEDIIVRISNLAIAVALACAAPPALAQTQVQVIQVPVQDGAPLNPPARYSFNRVDDGFLRFDNQSGQVAFCGPHAVGWACQAVPEDRAALEKEIARLQDEVAGLKTEIAGLREPSPPRPTAELTPRPTDKSEDAVKLREDIERARVAIENAWRRLVEIIANFQKDMMRKG
jgi:hypothetical protein